MILKLSIQNFLLIKSTVLDMHSGLTVLTGESGAGKSLIFKAIRFCLGGKIDKSYIGPFGDMAKVTLELENHLPKSVQYEHGIEAPCLTITHELRAKSRKVTMNGKQISQHVIQSIIEHLILDCQQSRSLSLLEPSQQQILLDSALSSDLLKAYHAAKSDYNNLAKDKAACEKALDIDSEKLQAACDELRDALPQDMDYDKLVDAINEIKSSEQLSDLWQDGKSQVYHTEKMVLRIKDISNQEIQTLCDELLQTTEALDSQIQNYLEEQAESRYQLAAYQTTLASLNDLGRKYRMQPRDLWDYAKTLEDQLQSYSLASIEYQKTCREYDAARLVYEKVADELDQARSQSADQLSKWLTPKLVLLGMEFAVCQVDYHRRSGTQILMKTNPGVDFKPIGECLSGGELSRLTLLLYVYQGDSRPWLLDEIDTGISGETAHKVRQMIKQVAKDRQVLCISHLAQVAVGADQHLMIQKSVHNNSANSQASYISEDMKDKELIRLMCGTKGKRDLLDPLYELVLHDKV